MECLSNVFISSILGTLNRKYIEVGDEYKYYIKRIENDYSNDHETVFDKVMKVHFYLFILKIYPQRSFNDIC